MFCRTASGTGSSLGLLTGGAGRYVTFLGSCLDIWSQYVSLLRATNTFLVIHEWRQDKQKENAWDKREKRGSIVGWSSCSIEEGAFVRYTRGTKTVEDTAISLCLCTVPWVGARWPAGGVGESGLGVPWTLGSAHQAFSSYASGQAGPFGRMSAGAVGWSRTAAFSDQPDSATRTPPSPPPHLLYLPRELAWNCRGVLSVLKIACYIFVPKVILYDDENDSSILEH